MRMIAGVSLVLLLAIPGVRYAHAQPGMYAAPPPPPVAPAPVVEAEPKVNLELALIAASPKGDWVAEDTLGADTSPGFGLQLGVAVSPNIRIFGGLRYVRVKFEDESQFPTEFNISHRELQLGLRFTTPIAPAAKLFLEGNVHSATISASVEGDSATESGVGLGVRGGVIFMVDRKIGLGLGVGYSSADISFDDEGGEDFEDAWLSGDLALNFFF